MTNAERMDRIAPAMALAYVVGMELPIDLRMIRPGQVIVLRDIDHVRYIEPLEPDPLLGCVAGWISDDDVEAA